MIGRIVTSIGACSIIVAGIALAVFGYISIISVIAITAVSVTILTGSLSGTMNVITHIVAFALGAITAFGYSEGWFSDLYPINSLKISQTESLKV